VSEGKGGLYIFGLVVISLLLILFGFSIGIEVSEGKEIIGGIAVFLSSSATLLIACCAFMALREYKESNIHKIQLDAIQRIRDIQISLQVKYKLRLLLLDFGYFSRYTLDNKDPGEEGYKYMNNVCERHMNDFLPLMALAMKIKANSASLLKCKGMNEPHEKFVDYWEGLDSTLAIFTVIPTYHSVKNNGDKEIYSELRKQMIAHKTGSINEEDKN